MGDGASKGASRDGWGETGRGRRMGDGGSQGARRAKRAESCKARSWNCGKTEKDAIKGLAETGGVKPAERKEKIVGK